MPNTNYFKIGVCAFAGLIIFLTGLFFIGLGGSLFKKRIDCVTFFDRSVQGLSVDSNVKFRGFNVGKVTSISLSPLENEQGQPVVKINFQIDPKVLGGNAEDLKIAKEYMENQTKRGLKAFLSFQGITGLGYLDLDYNLDAKSDLSESYALKAKLEDDIYIPNGPGQIMEISQAATNIVKSLSEVDFAGLSKDVKALLSTVESAVSKFEEGWLSADISIPLHEFHQAATSVRLLAQTLDETVGGGEGEKTLGKEIESSFSQLRNTLKRLDQLLGSSQGNLPMTLDNFRVMSENLRELSELLKEQPSQAIFGKPPKTSRSTTRITIDK